MEAKLSKEEIQKIKEIEQSLDFSKEPSSNNSSLLPEPGSQGSAQVSPVFGGKKSSKKQSRSNFELSQSSNAPVEVVCYVSDKEEISGSSNSSRIKMANGNVPNIVINCSEKADSISRGSSSRASGRSDSYKNKRRHGNEALKTYK